MASPNRPGVTVVQALAETTTVSAAPSLVPCVMGPCYQIIEKIDNGAPNEDALHSISYNQAGLVITQSNYPDPRDNIDEVDIDESSVSLGIIKGGSMLTFPRGSHSSYGTAFLKSVPGVYQPAVKIPASQGPISTSTTQALTLIVDGESTVIVLESGSYTLQQVSDAINDSKPGISKLNSAGDLIIFSKVKGAGGSLIIAGSGIGELLLDSLGGFSSGDYYKVTGSGLRGWDNGSSSETTPYIEYSRGTVSDGSSLTALSSSDFATITFAGFLDEDADFTSSQPSAVTFTGSGATIPLKAASGLILGDALYLAGDSSAYEVKSVQKNKFKLGSVNAALSTSSSRVLDDFLVGKLTATGGEASPFVPGDAYFYARGLQAGESDGTAATIESGAADVAAQQATLFSGTISGLTFPTTELDQKFLTIVVTKDGVEQDPQTINFSGSIASLAALATLIDAADDITCSSDTTSTSLIIKTSSSGGDQSVKVFVGDSNLDAGPTLGFASTVSSTGVSALFADKAVATATYTYSSGDFSGPLDLALTVVDSRGSMEVTATVPGATYNTAADLITAISTATGSNTPGNIEYRGEVVAVLTNDGSTGWTLTSVQAGPSVSMDIDADNAGADIFEVLGFSDGVVEGTSNLAGTELQITLDGNPDTYDVSFESDALDDAIDAINDEIGGDVAIAAEISGNKFRLTSAVLGASSSIKTSGASAITALNNIGTSATGTGRPNPDFYLDSSGSIHIGANLIRNPNTGVPLSRDNTYAIYIGYKGLRSDVTASAADPALLNIDSVEVLEAAIGPISTENPLALGAYLALLNAPTQIISAIGIDEVSAAAPLGTEDGYLRALEFLESKEVYALAPLTDNKFIQQSISTHVQAMSTPEERGERIAFIWQDLPTRAVDTSIQSGTAGYVGSSDNLFRVDPDRGTPADALDTAGISDLSSIDIDKNVYVQLILVSGGVTELRNYSVSAVSNETLTLRTSFSSSENTDGFYSAKTLDSSISYGDVTYALRIRGKELVVPGTTIKDYNAIASAAASEARAYDHRRIFMLFGSSVDISLNGVVTKVPGYYIAPGIAGMVAQQAPQQPFTNLSMAGYGKVYGTDGTFTENQMDTIADGGRYIMVNLGGAITSRHQRSTAISSIEKRELSITKAIDFIAKGLRDTNRVFIGKFVITSGFLDQLTMANQGFLRYVVELGVVNRASLKSLLQDETAPDTVLIEIEVAPAYPCNKIRITIVS